MTPHLQAVDGGLRAAAARRAAGGLAFATPLALLGGITLGTAALLPCAAAAALRVNLR